jgi:hypothetical protein
MQTSPPASLPSIFVQMVLPEGRLRLYQAMQSLQAPTAAAAAAAGTGSGQFQGVHQRSSKASPAAASAAAAGLPTDATTFYRSSTLTASQVVRDGSSSAGCCSGGKQQQQQQQQQPMPSGAPFWRRFAARMHVLCLGELRHALMAHSCVGVPGVISLLSNLCVTSDFEVENLEKVRCRV